MNISYASFKLFYIEIFLVNVNGSVWEKRYIPKACVTIGLLKCILIISLSTAYPKTVRRMFGYI